MTSRFSCQPFLTQKSDTLNGINNSVLTLKECLANRHPIYGKFRNTPIECLSFVSKKLNEARRQYGLRGQCRLTDRPCHHFTEVSASTTPERNSYQ